MYFSKSQTFETRKFLTETANRSLGVSHFDFNSQLVAPIFVNIVLIRFLLVYIFERTKKEDLKTFSQK